MLQHMENAITDELDEDFVNEVEIAVKAIYSQLPLKFIGSSTMNGTTFVKFLQNVVKRMNNSETSTLLSIPSEYESVIQFFAQEAVNESVRKYKERMGIMTNEKGKLPILWEEFEGMHNECILEINKSFFEKIIGSPIRFAKQLNEELSKIKEEFMEANSKKLTIHNEKIAKESWARNVEIGLTREKISSFKNSKEFQEALKSFELDYNKSMMKSPEAIKILASYKKNQYLSAIDHMRHLRRIRRMKTKLAKAMRAKEEKERLKLEALAREEVLRMKIEALKREREEYERNIENKMLELQINIEQQKNSREMKQHLIEEKVYAVEEMQKLISEMEPIDQPHLNRKKNPIIKIFKKAILKIRRINR